MQGGIGCRKMATGRMLIKNMTDACCECTLDRSRYVARANGGVDVGQRACMVNGGIAEKIVTGQNPVINAEALCPAVRQNLIDRGFVVVRGVFQRVED